MSNAAAPVCLTVPGLGNSTEGHWQTVWEATRPDCRRIELGHWEAPIREVWVGRIDAAVAHAGAPVVFATHSLGGVAIAWWAAGASSDRLARVRGALIVAPPNLDRDDMPREIAGFRPTPGGRLPFPTVVVASSDDPYCSVEAARALADGWGAELVVAGAHGHMNAAAELGEWPAGQAILDRLLAGAAEVAAR